MVKPDMTDDKCMVKYCRKPVVVLGNPGPMCAAHHEEQLDEMTRVARERLIREGKLVLRGRVASAPKEASSE